MAASIDVKELEAELSKTRGAFEAWAKSRTEAALQTRDTHLQSMQDQSAKLSGLRTRLAQLSVAAQQVKQRAEREEHEAVSLQSARSLAQQEEQVMQQRVSLLIEQVQAQEQECTQQEDAASLEEGVKKKKVNALRKALALYSSHLGLEFKQSGEVLQLVFSQIDAAQPGKQFVVGVNVQNGQNCTYKVTECNPRLDRLRELESKLNANNDFSEFVKSVRCAFKALPNTA